MTAVEEYTNVATTTVSSGGTDAPSSGTSETWTVASSSPFPPAVTGSVQFHVADPAAPSEMILVTNISGTTWTVTRGAESTTPVTHTAGFTIWLVVTAGDLTALATQAFVTAAVAAAAPFPQGLVTLTDAATIAVNAAAGSVFRCTLGGNRTLGTPSNPADGQPVVFEFIQGSGGGFTLGFSAAYAFPASIPQPSLSTTAGQRDFLQFRYDAGESLWQCTGWVPDQNAGVVTIPQGGTGQVTQQAALNALAGAQTAGEFLRGNGTDVEMSTIQASDLPAATTSALGAVELSGDLGGTATAPEVLKIQGTTISAFPGGTTEFLAGNGTFQAAGGGGGSLPESGGTMTGNLELAEGTASLAPLSFQAGTKLTTPEAGDAEFDGTAFYLTAAASSRQVLDAEQFQVLTSSYTLANNTNAQPLLNATADGALTVQASTTYFFECMFNITSLSGSTHSTQFSIGGTATLSAIAYEWIAGGGNPSSSLEMNMAAVATAVTIVTAGTAAACNAVIRGSFQVGSGGGGTVIPEVTQLTNSAAAVVAAGTRFRCWPVGAAGVTNVGDWS